MKPFLFFKEIGTFNGHTLSNHLNPAFERNNLLTPVITQDSAICNNEESVSTSGKSSTDVPQQSFSVTGNVEKSEDDSKMDEHANENEISGFEGKAQKEEKNKELKCKNLIGGKVMACSVIGNSDETDHTLEYVADILTKIHREFYYHYDKDGGKVITVRFHYQSI